MKRPFTLILTSIMALIVIAGCSAGATTADPISHAKEKLDAPIFTPSNLPEGFKLNTTDSYFVDGSLFLSYQNENGEKAKAIDIYIDNRNLRDVNEHLYKYINDDYEEEPSEEFLKTYKTIGSFTGKLTKKDKVFRKEKYNVFIFQFLPERFVENKTTAHFVIKTKNLTPEEFEEVVASLEEQ